MTTPSIPTTTPSEMFDPPIARERKKSRVPRGKRDMNPRVFKVTVDGQRALAVAMSGGKGRGKRILIDPADWTTIADHYGPVWVLNDNGGGRAYVCSAAASARYAAGQTAGHPKANLARIIAGNGEPLTGRAVTYLNGDLLDLRRANLKIIPLSECWSCKPSCPPPVIVEGWLDA
jgi:hypothetical protein